MALADPHIGMERRFVQSVAVCLLLCIEHQCAETVGIEEFRLSVFKDRCFKQVAGVDIADDLRRILQAGFQQRQLFVLIGRACNGSSGDERFVERRCGFRNGHRVVLRQRGVGEDHLVVEGVT